MTLVGLFRENELYQADINKNTETLYYSRNDDGKLIGINKTLSSSIRMIMQNQEINDIYYYNNVDGTLTPEPDYPENARKLKGFNWRGDERLQSKEDLFKGQAPPELTKIKGIPLPEEQEEFFDERKDGEEMLLNENSRLKPEDLQNRHPDSTKVRKEMKKAQDSLLTKPQQKDSVQIE